ncbi:MAG TPA: tetratricopeptide repeat protein [Chroococcidiopsis sp.]
MNDPSVDLLLKNLKDDNAALRAQATQELWRRWFYQKGVHGLQLLEQAQRLLDAGAIDAAEAALTEVINQQPDFAEAWNRRAVLYYLQHRYRKAIADCQQVIALNPIHFGALHGTGLCYMALGDYSNAIYAFRQALNIQPHAIENQRLILECNAKLS